MKRLFAIVIGLDVLLLALPTRWMGPRFEFGIAVTLCIGTALLLLWVHVFRES